MGKNGFTFQNIPFEARDCENWPKASPPSAEAIHAQNPLLSMEEARRRAVDVKERFERLSRGIRKYMKIGSLKDALSEAQCSKPVFYAQLNRCLTSDLRHGQLIVGWAGLISQLRLKPYERTSDGAGTAGLFTQWLALNDDWKVVLEEIIKSGNGAKGCKARAPDVRNSAKNFIQKIRRGIPKGKYPNDRPDCARRSVERYIDGYISTHPDVAAVWFGEDVAKSNHLNTGPQSFNLAAAPFDVIGGDGHSIDAIGIVIMDGPNGPIRVPVERIQLFAAICHSSRVVLGYSACIVRQIDSGKVEEAFEFASTPWKPKPLTIENLSYDPNAGFPCGSIPGVTEINPAHFRLDNASPHWAKRISGKLRSSLGCAVSFGGIGRWWRNAVTERLFGSLARYGFQRLPSSMGSGTQDPHRAENPVAEATGRGIEWSELLQILDVLLANYNAKPHRDLGGVSPLDHLRTSLESRRPGWLPRIRAPHSACAPKPGVQVFRRTIAGSAKTGTAPYVQVFGPHYTAPCLSDHYEWIGRSVDVHIPNDMRTVEIYLDSGGFIGEIKCLDKGWNLSPHDLSIRRAINVLIDRGEMYVPPGGDPMVIYMDHLAKKSTAGLTGSIAAKVSRDATQAAELSRKTGLPVKRNTSADSTSAAANASRYKTRKALGISLPDNWK